MGAAIRALEATLPSVEEILRAYEQEADLAAEGVPIQARLLDNFPNPFNSSTQLLFQLRQAGPVQLWLYDLAGQKVRTLVDEYRLPGAYQVEWDGKDEAGQPVGSGVYLYRLEAGGQVHTHKLLLLR